MIRFVTGIDTDSGKSVVTGLLYRYLLNNNIIAITIKPIQTGCNDISEDIETHRRIAEIDLLDIDKLGETSSYIFKFPASPHLAAKLEGKVIDKNKIINDIKRLSENFDEVIVEGAGGLYVPITEDYGTVDLIKELGNIGVILITSSKVGSINHTILTIKAIIQEKLQLEAIIYNEYPLSNSPIIEDSYRMIDNFREKNCPNVKLYRVKNINERTDYDFSDLFLKNGV
ncbi:MAG: dethiobiotin synthase [Candidatus Delongbacteria bacterium]|nr:dethiobiotin synthase [Candidatus Delongbacteria bacterium]MBN2835348.1 dethiobiotin synthase [Candidatus Delongbacteria bacterium]